MKSNANDYIAIHLEPAWRARANFIITAEIGGTAIRTEREQLWARQTDEFCFELCCIPFFVYDLAIGDEVRTDPQYVIRQLIKPSGHYTFRVWFGASEELSRQDELVTTIRDLGCEFERSSANLLAIDAASVPLAEKLADYLFVCQSAGQLVYEAAFTSDGKDKHWDRRS
jgi:Domain of unknown function (DUF4265)